MVTGASSGIGECVARRLIERGERVLAVARRGELLERLCAGHAEARPLALDLCADDAAERVAEVVGATFGKVKGLVHCAGFSSPAPVGMIAAETARRLFAVHALFPLSFLGWMKKAAHHEQGASCVLMTSLAVHEPVCGNASYAAAKGAVTGMLYTIAAELGERGIRVNALDPGIVDTDMVRTTWMRTMTAERLEEFRRRHPEGFRRPDDVAEAIVRLLDDPASGSGQVKVL